MDDALTTDKRELFISYSRQNKKVVRALVEQIEANGSQPWIDESDIPKAEPFWEEIKKGIAEANAFVFMASPASIQSEVCNWEVAYARRNGKRIIPVALSDFYKDAELVAAVETITFKDPDYDPAKNPDQPEKTISAKENFEALRQLNAIFAHTSARYAAAAEEIVTAANQDREHIKTHTRILLRAQAWDENRRRGYLLTGEETVEAEDWLLTSGGKDPAPTVLHGEYVNASRKVQRQRNRNLLSGVSVVLGVTLVLLMVAVTFFQESQTNLRTSQSRGTAVAEQEATATNALGLSQVRGTAASLERDRAEAQRMLVQARALSLEPLGNSETATLLGLAAYRMLGTEAAITVLRDLVPDLNTTAHIPQVVPELAEGMLLSSDPTLPFAHIPAINQWVVAVDSTVYVIDLLSGSLIASHTEHGEEPVLALAATSGQIVSIDAIGRMLFWSPTEGVIDTRTYNNINGNNPISLALSATHLAMVNNGQLRLMDLAQGRGQLLGPTDFARFAHVAFSPDGKHLAALTARTYVEPMGNSIPTFSSVLEQSTEDDIQLDELLVVEIETGAERTYGVPAGHFAPPVFSADGSKLAVALLSEVQVIDLETAAVQTLENPDEVPMWIAFNPSGNTLLGVYTQLPDFNATHMRLWDAQNGSIIRNLTGPQYIAIATFMGDDSRLASLQSDGSLRHWWADTLPVEDGLVIDTSTYAENALIVALPGDANAFAISLQPIVDEAAAAQRENRDLDYTNNAQLNQFTVIDLETGEALSTITIDENIFANVTQQGLLLIMDADGDLTNYSSDVPQALYRVDASRENIRNLEIIGARLIVSRSDEQHLIYDHPQGAQLYTIDASRFVSSTPFFQIEQNRVFFNNALSMLVFYDLRGGGEVARLEQPECRRVQAYHAPYVIASTENQNQLCVWDVEQNVLLSAEVPIDSTVDYEAYTSNDGWLTVVQVVEDKLQVQRWHTNHTAHTYNTTIHSEGQARVFKITDELIVLAVNNPDDLLVFDIASGAVLREFGGSTAAPFSNPDADILGALGGQALWENTLTTDYAVAGPFIASLIRLYNLRTGEQRTLDTSSAAELAGAASILSITLGNFTPGGTYLITHTLSVDSLVSTLEALESASVVPQVWILDYAAHACQRLVRGLTAEERQVYNVPEHVTPCATGAAA